MPAKLTLHPPQRASRFLVLRDGESLEIGRDPSCGLVLEDSRVSKRHARLGWTGRGWRIEDLGSKNGTTVNAEPPSKSELRHGDWLSLGGLMGRFDCLTPAQAASLESERLARLQTSVEMRRKLGADLAPVDLLSRFLGLAMQVTGSERGFVLVAEPDGTLRAVVAAGFSTAEVHDERFRGSASAVRQALETGSPVLAQDAHAHPFFGRRSSVVTNGIGSLACVPLAHEGKHLGAMYLDSRKLIPSFTGLDLEILESLADHTAMVLAGSLLDHKIRQLLRPPPGGLIGQLQRRIEELLPAI